MKAATATARRRLVAPAPAPTRIALLGTGTVGNALLGRLERGTGLAAVPLSLVHVGNSRQAVGNRFGLTPHSVLQRLQHGAAADLDAVEHELGEHGTRIVVDATASDVVAGRHAVWLRRGIHVVTACKLGAGTTLSRWRAIQAACATGGTCYGDSATVGAGLPLLRSIRALRAGGDEVHGIAGVLSGSLAWLFHRFDGMQPFSGFVRQARSAGYTEPDPREDLSGEDVRRKLLILARAAGFEAENQDVVVASLVPDRLARCPAEAVDAALPLLDRDLREQFAAAHRRGEKLRHLARLDDGRLRVGLEPLAADHPLAAGRGTDNQVAIWSDRYREQPLLIQGPGAGPAITAAALLDDVLAIARSA